MQHKEPKQVRLERVAHLLMCEVDEALDQKISCINHHDALAKTSMHLKNLQERIKELQALLKL